METFMICYAFGVLFSIAGICVYFIVKCFYDRRKNRYDAFIRRARNNGSCLGNLLRAAARNNGNPK